MAPTPVSFAPDPELPRRAQAASLALALMKKSKVRRWAEFDGVLPGTLALLPGQLDLLREFEPMLMLLAGPLTAAAAGTASALPAISVFVCPDCDRWGLISSGTAPSSCTLTFLCEGSPVKAGVAARVQP